ncbi:hypothetical protein Acr_27g0000380 [Actinidia rufa]|uniref:Uncharacterized protein n=1 Tax=Actinidia rufa TaxID=165716 RepID=A0A7J0H5G8_9ERIC|nr:hypothetical protein Acr_27g0000380 [Actinidia rufa]
MNHAEGPLAMKVFLAKDALLVSDAPLASDALPTSFLFLAIGVEELEHSVPHRFPYFESREHQAVVLDYYDFVHQPLF